MRGTQLSGRRYFRANWDLYLLLAPAVLTTLLFKYVPMGGLIIAFQNYNIFDGVAASPFVGLRHFVKLFQDRNFYRTLSNSFIISMYKLIFIFPLPIALAILLNEVRCLLFKRTVQTLVYLPHFLSWSIVYGIFYALLMLDGPVNDLRAAIGMSRIPFFVNPSVFRSILVVSDAWKGVGWGCIVYLAALTAIDPQLYEASRMDGAGKLRQIWHITLPGIRSSVVIMLVLRLGSLINAGFDQVFIMYNPTVYNVADILDTYVYRTGLGQQNFSYASAVGLFNSIVSLILVLSSNTVAKKWFGHSIW
ncbi:putative multiple-sugar transport system permease YteP [Clostridia bacterium]|nr:putative multiple-sugar transport system permease YteP [Clostridia bacterium]